MKKLASVLLAFNCLLTGAFAFGCTKKGKHEAAKKEYIGIISAMDNEIEKLLAETDIERVDSYGDEKYYVGTLRGKPVIITKSGIGKVRASSGATVLLNKYDISSVIFTGIAGGVADETKVLDEVVATALVEHDYGILSDDGFIWRSGDPGFGNQTGEYYYCDKDLVELAYSAAVETVGKEHVFKGTIASGDQFVASSEYVLKLQNDYNAYACEMEGAAVAVVCIKYKKPFVVIRALSDKADGNAHESYENFGDIAGDNSSRIVLKILENLS